MTKLEKVEVAMVDAMEEVIAKMVLGIVAVAEVVCFATATVAPFAFLGMAGLIVVSVVVDGISPFALLGVPVLAFIGVFIAIDDLRWLQSFVARPLVRQMCDNTHMKDYRSYCRKWETICVRKNHIYNVEVHEEGYQIFEAVVDGTPLAECFDSRIDAIEGVALALVDGTVR